MLADIAESHFKPAIQNMKVNLGEENLRTGLLEEVCTAALEAAKELYAFPSRGGGGGISVASITEMKKPVMRGKCPSQVLKRSSSSTSSSPVMRKSMVIKSGDKIIFNLKHLSDG